MASRERGKELYDLLLELDRLEELREELDERGLRSVEEIEQRIEEINAKVEALEGIDADEK
jgi:guanylate kinase